MSLHVRMESATPPERARLVADDRTRTPHAASGPGRRGDAVVDAPSRQAAALWRGLGEVPAGFGPCVVTIGVFDGLHRGHRRLVEHAVRAGQASRLPTVLVTFDPHPARVLGSTRDTARLSTIGRRAELAGELGLDAVCALPFTAEFAQFSPAEFAEQVIVAGLRARTVVVGTNFTFGHRAAGTVSTLCELGLQHGFTTQGVRLLHEADTRCSSSAVRAFLRHGDVDGARRLLGRPHRVEGTVHPVDDGVRELVTPPGTALPAPGRYRGRFPGAGPATLIVTEHGRLLIDPTTTGPGPVSVEFTGRQEP